MTLSAEAAERSFTRDDDIQRSVRSVLPSPHMLKNELSAPCPAAHEGESQDCLLMENVPVPLSLVEAGLEQCNYGLQEHLLWTQIY